MSEQAIERTVYRVVHWFNGKRHVGPTFYSLRLATEAVDATTRASGNQSARLQQRTVISTPWEDVEAEEASC